jgi:chemotaxis protein methyltransferase CheR
MPYPGQFDLVFCRNVFIYFNPEQIKKSSEHQIKTLAPHGYFFIGISETLNGLKVDSEYVGPSVYRQAQPKSAKPAMTVVQPQTSVAPALMPAPKLAPKPAPLLRVLCVDDSSSILTLLKRILSKENGFEVVATATNGREAFDVLKSQQVDLITLDIHMPEMDGLTFLEKSKGMMIPPVLMISSVNRENSTTALRALELGAADYVEKPTMANLAERGDEIRAKLLTISLAKSMPVSGLSALDQSFKKEFKITEPAKKLRVGFFGLGDKKKMSYFIKNNSPKDPPAIFAVEGAPEALKGLSEQLKAERAIEIKLDLNNLKPGDVALVDFKENADKLKTLAGQLKTSVVVTGVPTQKVCDFVLQLSSIHLYLEDLGPYSEAAQKSLLDVASFKAPLTSYFSVSEEYFD